MYSRPAGPRQIASQIAAPADFVPGKLRGIAVTHFYECPVVQRPSRPSFIDFAFLFCEVFLGIFVRRGDKEFYRRLIFIYVSLVCYSPSSSLICQG